MLQMNVADGVHRVEDAHTNWYLAEDDRQLTVVDAGVPRSWQSLQAALAELGRKPADIAAVVLTHAHFDHLGFAERARVELDVPVYVHARLRSAARLVPRRRWGPSPATPAGGSSSASST